MSERAHLLLELDALENRQRSLQAERALLDSEEGVLLERKILINTALGETALYGTPTLG